MDAFSLFLPPSWIKVDLTHDVTGAVERVAGRYARQVPYARQPQLRRQVIDHLTPFAEDLSAHGVICVVMSTAPTVEEPVRPFATFAPLPDEAGIDPFLTAQALVGDDPTSTIMEVDGLIGIRTTATSEATEAARAAQPLLDQVMADPAVPKADLSGLDDEPGEDVMVSTRVRYVIGDPSEGRRWLDVQLAIDHPSGPEAIELAEAQVGLFDAVMTTLRWEQ